jgi:hypothetical protein
MHGQVDADNVLDALTCNAGSLSLLRGVGNDTFSALEFVTTVSISTFSDLDVADFTDVGRPDLVVGANEVLIWLNLGSAVTQPRVAFDLAGSIDANHARDLLVVDLNGNKHLDLFARAPICHNLEAGHLRDDTIRWMQHNSRRFATSTDS